MQTSAPTYAAVFLPEGATTVCPCWLAPSAGGTSRTSRITATTGPASCLYRLLIFTVNSSSTLAALFYCGTTWLLPGVTATGVTAIKLEGPECQRVFT